MGESREDEVKFLHTLANLDPYPESVPLNKLVPIKGTPLKELRKLMILNSLKLLQLQEFNA